MSDVPTPKPARFVLASFPERYALPGKPSGAAAAVADAHRQTGFLLGEELALFERAMNLQLEIVATNAKAKGTGALAVFSFWSRTFGLLGDACTLMTSGSYASCAPVLRTALDCIAAQRAFIADGFVEYGKWHEGAATMEPGSAALVIGLERFRDSTMLIEDPSLGLLYRLLTDLSMSHVGGTLFITAPEASLEKLPVGFADSSFHLAWAELVTNWLLRLAGLQLETVVTCDAIKLGGALTESVRAVQRDVESALGNPRRCHVEDAGGRFVFHNFRRAPTGQPKRVVLG
jgi:hypothetical protein